MKNLVIIWQRLSKKYGQWLFFLLVFLASLFLKTWQLDRIPISLHPDERVYAANAQSIGLSGKNLAGNWQFLSLQPLGDMYAELPAVVTAIGLFFTENNFLAVKIPSVFFSLNLPLLMALLAWKLFAKKEIFFLTFAVASFNPWLWQFGRMAFDPLPGIFFYFLALVLMFFLPKYGKLLAILPAFLGFYQYQGLKIIFLPIFLTAIAFLGWQTWRERKSQKVVDKKLLLPHFSLLVVFIVFFLSYLFWQLPQQGAVDRLSQQSIFSPNYRLQLGGLTDLERRLSLDSSFLPIYANKGAVFFAELVKKTVAIYDPTHLFIANDAALSGFSVWSQGLFYLLDGILLFFFALFLLVKSSRRDKKSFLFLGALFIFGAIPAYLNVGNNWFTFRASFSYLILIFPLAYSLAWLWQRHKLSFYLIAFLYLLSILRFSYDYFYRYPIYSSQGLYFQEKVLSSYLFRVKDKPVKVYSHRFNDYFESYLFYNNLITAENLPKIEAAYKDQDKIEFGQITFLRASCVALENESVVIIKDNDFAFCQDEQASEAVVEASNISIASLLDSGEQMKIYHDPLCQAHPLRNYLYQNSLAPFSVEKLTDREFCLNWLIAAENQ